MATSYLTPGVYVEEVPSANKPIEGVGTSIAAFVGLAPGGPVNRPIRISNWTQFATIFGDAAEPGERPVHGRARTSPTASTASSRTAAGSAGSSASASSDGGVRQAALPARRRRQLRGLPGGRAEGRRHRRQARADQPRGPGGGDGDDSPATYKLMVTAGSESEEFDGLSVEEGPRLHRHEGERRLEADQARGDRRQPARDVTLRDRQLHAARCRSSRATRSTPSQFEGDVAKREGMGGLAAVDEITMVCCPDAVTFAGNGDDTGFRDLQGKMIAHCENMGDRMAILDPPPNLIPQDVLDWRMNAAGYDSKFATLYYPWLEVMDPLTKRPLLVPPSGHVAGVWARTDGTRGVHKAPANEVVLGVNGLAFQITQRGAGRPEPARDQLHPRVPRPRHPHLGRAHALERSRVALRQRPPALQLRLRVDHGGHAVGRVRAERRAPLEHAADLGLELPQPHLATGRAVRGLARARPST